MAFDIVLMRNNSEKIRADKDLTTLLTVSGVLKEETSLIDPSIKIECDFTTAASCNYLYIQSFGRYYFVNNTVTLRNGLVEFSCHVDVLTSNITAIRANKGIVKRQENKWNLYINDGAFRVYQNPIITTKNFPSGFTNKQFVLAIAGPQTRI